MKSLSVSFDNVIRENINKMEDIIVNILVFLFKPAVQFFYKKYYTFKNYSAKKKERVMKSFLRKVATVSALLVVGVLIALGASVFEQRVNAHNDEILHKYYTSVTVEPGDTLWSIADEYYTVGYENHSDYIDEVMHINHLERSNEIISGTSLVVPYYSSEIK